MLKKLFIKNYENIEDTNVRNQYGRVAGFFGIITNLILGTIKLIIGLISRSVSIMADAVNNIADSVNSVLTMVGFKLASKDPTQKHPYGFARYEYVTGMIIAILMVETGLLFAKESIQKIISPDELTINLVTYIVLIVAIIGKVIQMFVYLDFAKTINSDTLKTNALDARNDIISTSAILISMIIMATFKINIDAYLGLAVSLFVIYSSVSMLKDVLEPIIGIVPTQEQIKLISSKILSYEGVEGIHDMVIHNYGVHNDFVIVHVEFDYKTDILKAHDLMDNIESDFKEELGINLTIHMDPIVLDDPKVEILKQKVDENLKKLDETLMIHDFRIVDGPTHTNVLFDCVVPYDKKYTEKELYKFLQGKIKNEDENHRYFYVINIDRPYC